MIFRPVDYWSAFGQLWKRRISTPYGYICEHWLGHRLYILSVNLEDLIFEDLDLKFLQMSETRNIRELYQAAEMQKRLVDSASAYSGSTYLANLAMAIRKFEDCKEQAAKISLFSINETLEDVASRDLPYVLIL